MSRPAQDHPPSLTAPLSPQERRWLGAIAAERVLGLATLARMTGASQADPAALARWLAGAVASGLLVEVPPSQVPSLTSSPAHEPLFAVHPAHEQLVLRDLAGRGELDDIADETRFVLGARSVSPLAAALQNGDLPAFNKAYSAPRLPGLAPDRSSADWLRASLCAPFDPEWLTRTWGDDAIPVATRVLHESLDAPDPCPDLHAWLHARRPEVEDPEHQLSLQIALYQHAIFGGATDPSDIFAPVLAPVTTFGFQAAASFQRGDLAAAHSLLDEALRYTTGRTGRAANPRLGAIAPVLALLLCGRDTTAATAAAKRMFAAPATDAERGAARAFRTLLRYLEEPESRHRRIDFHHLPPGAGAWEILLTALTVHLHLEQPATRASWAQNLVRKAVSWQQAGREWLSRQALFLANDLDAGHCQKELARQGLSASVLLSRPRELSLWDLLARKPEWQKTLAALAQVSESVTESPEMGYRVAWFMDMTDGSFGRPALQQYRAAAGGWTQGQRLSFAELHEREPLLPPEDVRVLRCSTETFTGRREPTPEAHEMLIGHPRVFNGARGMTPVEVVRGTCRVETHEDGGHIRVVVEPEGAELGINVVPQSETRLVVYRVTRAMRRVIEVLPHGIRIPRSHEPELLRVLDKLAQTVEVKSPQLGVERAVAGDTTPCIRIAPQAGAWLVQIGVRPFGARGRFFLAGVGRASVTLHEEGKRLRCDRDFQRERERVDELMAECPTLQRHPEDEQSDAEAEKAEDRWLFGEEMVLALLADLKAAKSAHELEWPESAAFRLRGTVTSKNLHARLRSIKGWYLATGGVRLDEVTEVSLNDLSRAPALSGGRFLRLPGGDYLEVEKRIRRVVAALGAASPARRKGAEIAIHPGAVSALQELAAPESGFDVDEATADWLRRLAEMPRKSFPVPEALRAELRLYQVEGFRWLCRLAELGLGACLADDMGLGKTVQILALLLTRTDGPALVVAPTSVCANWALETRRFAPTLTPIEYGGDERAALLEDLAHHGAGKVIICSYALLQQDEALLTAVAWDTVVLDEAQLIKNAESLRAKAACRLSARQRIAATGTPVENHFGDLWSIFQFLNPGLLGDWAPFNRRFVKPLERDGGAAPQAELRELVRPYVLRRLKRDVLAELPPVTEVIHEVRLGADDAMRYALLRKQIHDKLFTSHGKKQNKLEVLAEITRLRRFCCHPRLVFPEADTESAKITALLELVEELRENQHRALVFSQYVDFLGLVREQLDERAIRYEYLDGSTPKAQRQARVDAFQAGGASLFLISLKAGGFGLNLTAADYVIHLDPWWNPAVEAQATDRAHRIGQDRRVTVYRLVTRDTIEEKIMALHGKKQKLARSLLDGGEEAAKLGAEDLARLIAG